MVSDELRSYTRLSMPVLERATDTLISIGLIRATDEQPRRYLPHHSVEDVALNDVRVLLRQHSWQPQEMRTLPPERMQIRKFMQDVDSHWAECSANTSFRKLLEQEQTTNK